MALSEMMSSFYYRKGKVATIYTNERNSSNIHSGNKASWSGKIALLYPSDFAYSRSSNYWTQGSSDYYYPSWIYRAADIDANYGEWMLTQSTSDSGVSVWTRSDTAGAKLSYNSPYGSWYYVRPVLNLLSTATIEDNGADGSETNPYVLVE